MLASTKRGAHVRVTKRRKIVKSLLVLVAVLSIVVGVLVATRDDVEPPAPPTETAPTLQEVNRAISLADANVKGLYRTLELGQAVQSEYYGLPLRMELPDRDAWALLGDEQCLMPCVTGVDVTSRGSTVDSESYQVNFGGFLVADVTMNWRTYVISVKPRQVSETAVLYLDEMKLATFEKGDAKKIDVTLKSGNRRSFRSMRYTVRHATQEAYMYAVLRGDKKRAGELASFLRANGFTPGYDVRAAIAGMSRSLPDNLPVDAKAYLDCKKAPKRTGLTAYSYRSKVCLAGDVYFTAAERDPLLQATYALHTLQKYRDVKHQYDGNVAERWWRESSSPRATSQHLQRLWVAGAGMPKCTPLKCDTVASGIRTFTFGTLETVMGYGYGNERSKRYADAAAHLTVKRQMQPDGLVKFGDTTLYRPVNVGGFLLAWDADGKFVDPSKGSTALGVLGAGVLSEVSMAAEYRGFSPSNSETTFDGLFFLLHYRCLKFDVGCKNIGFKP